MFLYRSPTTWIRESCFFNLVNQKDARNYNLLLSYEGRGIRVLKQKEWGTTGFAAPDFNSPDGDGGFEIRVKDDAFYIFVMYDRSSDCPYKAPHRAELHEDNVLAYKNAKGQHIEIEVGPGDNNDTVLARISAAMGDDPPGDESDEPPFDVDEPAATGRRRQVTIDVSAEPPAKERKAPKPRKGAMSGKPKTEGVADFTKKRASKAKTVGEAQEILVDGALANLKEAVESSAKAVVKEMKGAGKQGQSDMVGYLADQLRINPEGAKAILAKMLAEKADNPMFKGQTVDSMVSRILAMDNGVARGAKVKAPAKTAAKPAPKGGKKRK